MAEDNLQNSEEEKINKQIKRRTFFAFSVFVLANATAYVGWRQLGKQPQDNGTLKLLRSMLYNNEKVNQFFFSDHHLAKQYSKEQALSEVKVNGEVGLQEGFDFSTWSLSVTRRPGDENNALKITMDDIKSFAKQDLIFDFKCIEGWDMITHWGGTRFSDFLIKYKLGTRSGATPDPNHPEDLYKYVGLMTPDNEYYVGIDMKSIMHPQTLLCYEMNEQPLLPQHGFPLRLIIPVKYGVKNLKCISSMYFSDTRPPDYWFERGYDYDCAL